MLARAKAIPEASLNPRDKLTRVALVTEVEDELAELSCDFQEWTVDPLGGPQAEFMDLADYTIIETPEDAAHYVQRARLMGRYLDDHIQNLRTGKSHGRVAARDARSSEARSPVGVRPPWLIGAFVGPPRIPGNSSSAGSGESVSVSVATDSLVVSRSMANS